MSLAPPLRKAVLTAHVATSVGWLGAVVAYIALDITAATTSDADLARAAYAAMRITALSAILPLAVASVVIGIVNAVGTSWGLFRHYWVVVKLLMTLVATAVLVLETATVRALADMASVSDPRELPGTLAHSVGGLLVLLLVTILSIYKPRGLTRYGWRRQREEARRAADRSAAAV